MKLHGSRTLQPPHLLLLLLPGTAGEVQLGPSEPTPNTLHTFQIDSKKYHRNHFPYSSFWRKTETFRLEADLHAVELMLTGGLAPTLAPPAQHEDFSPDLSGRQRRDFSTKSTRSIKISAN